MNIVSFLKKTDESAGILCYNSGQNRPISDRFDRFCAGSRVCSMGKYLQTKRLIAIYENQT